MDASSSPNTQPAPEAVHVDHFCEHPGCAKWGSFGRPGQTGQTVWKCFAHDPVYGAAE